MLRRAWMGGPLAFLLVLVVAAGATAEEGDEVQVIADAQGDAAGVSGAHDLVGVWVGTGERSLAEIASGGRFDVRIQLASLALEDVAWYRVHWGAASFHAPNQVVASHGVEVELVAGVASAVSISRDGGAWMARFPLQAEVDLSAGMIRVFDAPMGGGVFPVLAAFQAEAAVLPNAPAFDRATGDTGYTPPAYFRLATDLDVPRRGMDLSEAPPPLPAGAALEGAWMDHSQEGVRVTYRFASLAAADLDACPEWHVTAALAPVGDPLFLHAFLALRFDGGVVTSTFLSSHWTDNEPGEERVEYPLEPRVDVQFGSPAFVQVHLASDDWPGLPLIAELFQSVSVRCKDVQENVHEAQISTSPRSSNFVFTGAGGPAVIWVVLAGVLLVPAAMVIAGVVLFVRLFKD